ncbi:HK97 gp10 family phage protein [Streptomyces sp. DH12]|uniref:HK97 gp10 family phage protein n=1 Tax=Streptomyces sp. DH12 TaxID=2857010 RepID=UPI001E31071D|nr:HK97 gp10 family phage protein [Streptomyces sp. DH12]
MTPDELADRLEQAADRIGPAVERRIRHVGTLGVAEVRANASGRPGPNVITGAYRASWRADTRGIPYGAQCTIGSDAPQARRLEFGFYDMTDSLGRHYLQPPFPHVQPALPQIGATLRAQMRQALEEVFE